MPTLTVEPASPERGGRVTVRWSIPRRGDRMWRMKLVALGDGWSRDVTGDLDPDEQADGSATFDVPRDLAGDAVRLRLSGRGNVPSRWAGHQKGQRTNPKMRQEILLPLR